MVSQYPGPDDRHRMAADDHAMRMRLRPSDVIQGPPAVITASNLAPPPWRIEINAADGTMLVTFREENGCLVVEGDESRWDEAAKRFLHGMMQWAGGAGIRWKDDVRKAAG